MPEIIERALPVAANARAVQGQWPEGVFEDIFRRHYVHIVNLISRITADEDNAEDIVGAAYWKLYQRPELAKPGNNLPGWLYRTASRMALDSVRQLQRRRRGLLLLHRQPAAAPIADPGVHLEDRERVQRVRRALSRLKPVHAQILLLRHQGASYAELATLLGMKPTSVGTTLVRAEKAFVTQWQKLEVGK
ncbi:MAG: sigma-70 family RNA polymerase sigma factor [Terriglobales bacterium]